ncbi:hypothetical protein LEP1GSC060_2519 [Leptospira weilii serovar Ranarum str. ICFT]|uniref:Uncharacterized protein n=1 Tax=Leptospira weilii serovar Ranarum str. ICFT TaxID=1218598 RepID=N1WKA8_9LEPT|nr:hypothetical protein LEP1GSC060_2519 [Leptospira weilii serovar Ranarum str. ICFT]
MQIQTYTFPWNQSLFPEVESIFFVRDTRRETFMKEFDFVTNLKNINLLHLSDKRKFQLEKAQ